VSFFVGTRRGAFLRNGAARSCTGSHKIPAASFREYFYLWRETDAPKPAAAMLHLNLPPFPHQIKQKDGKLYIFDILRKKYIFLTPEEWVRQHFIHYLINQYQYPKALMRVEGGLTYNTLKQRTDLVVYDRTGKPFALVECKDTLTPLTQQTFEQAARYNYVLKAPFLIIANGLSYACCQVDHQAGTYRHLDDIPPYSAE
jgi:hypothetical protein